MTREVGYQPCCCCPNCFEIAIGEPGLAVCVACAEHACELNHGSGCNAIDDGDSWIYDNPEAEDCIASGYIE